MQGNLCGFLNLNSHLASRLLVLACQLLKLLPIVEVMVARKVTSHRTVYEKKPGCSKQLAITAGGPATKSVCVSVTEEYRRIKKH